ncbi:MAG: NAD(P)-dependent alcohol dehydrogenase [Spirochaetales bacterium]|nr:NAD(P)-dependent alcohol dehydrogenase [Spirochaetales bacterium]
MKAIVYDQYGGPEVLRLAELKMPRPGAEEILLKVCAASVNAADWHIMRGSTIFDRLQFGLLRPKLGLLGMDVAGIVEAVGDKVEDLRPGDAVFGECRWGGAFAEYLTMHKDWIVRKPRRLSFEEAAALPVSGLTALEAVRYKGCLTEGERVLVNGASGGVGSFAVQIAKAYGGRVSGVCNGIKADIIQFLGADRVIDYNKGNFFTMGETWDLIIDTVGCTPVSAYMKVLSEKGRCVIVGYHSFKWFLHHRLWGPLLSRKYGKEAGLIGNWEVQKSRLEVLKGLVVAGKVKPYIDRIYELDEVPNAMRYIEGSHPAGKIVVAMA